MSAIRQLAAQARALTPSVTPFEVAATALDHHQDQRARHQACLALAALAHPDWDAVPEPERGLTAGKATRTLLAALHAGDRQATATAALHLASTLDPSRGADLTGTARSVLEVLADRTSPARPVDLAVGRSYEQVVSALASLARQNLATNVGPKGRPAWVITPAGVAWLRHHPVR